MTEPTSKNPQPKSRLRSIAGTIAALAVYLALYATSQCSWSRGAGGGRVEGACVLYSIYGLAVIASLIIAMRSLHRRGLSNKWTSEGRCPRCGYDLTNAPKDSCPECGPLTPPAPSPAGSPALCARCRGDMTGREGRICPDCGAMYGMEYTNPPRHETMNS